MPTRRKRLIVKVDRKRWYRGKGMNESALLRQDDTMCCIGFACLAAGLSPLVIQGRDAVRFLSRESIHNVRGALRCSVAGTAEWLVEAYRTNDKIDLDDAEREKKLKALGAENGVTFKFVG